MARARERWILIDPLETGNTTKAGLIIDQSDIRFRKGKIVSSGIEDIEEGSIAIYDFANSHETMIEGKKYLITKADYCAIIL